MNFYYVQVVLSILIFMPAPWGSSLISITHLSWPSMVATGATGIWAQVWLLPKALAMHFMVCLCNCSLLHIFVPIFLILYQMLSLGTHLQCINTGRFQTPSGLFQPLTPSLLGTAAGNPNSHTHCSNARVFYLLSWGQNPVLQAWPLSYKPRHNERILSPSLVFPWLFWSPHSKTLSKLLCSHQQSLFKMNQEVRCP
jgi:hypothetical protein